MGSEQFMTVANQAHAIVTLAELRADIDELDSELRALRVRRAEAMRAGAVAGCTEREMADAAGVTAAYVNRMKHA